jgi:hypothetical protein
MYDIEILGNTTLYKIKDVEVYGRPWCKYVAKGYVC